LRVAVKYMVTSMLTGTSTIFGLFQAIGILLKFRCGIAAAEGTLRQNEKPLNLFAR
jgi:hypothetical protein